jgi:Raf kinase inhibitor-like YbhB/YbcL family protein
MMRNSIWVLSTAALLLAACATGTPAAAPLSADVPAATATEASVQEAPSEEPAATPAPFELSSPAFENDGVLPDRYSCVGENVSPELNWGDPPEGTHSMVLIFDDPDAPGGSWVHWVVYNLPPEARGLPEAVAPNEEVPGGGVQGANSWGTTLYGGSCPPEGANHRYVFFLYALDTELAFENNPNKKAVLAAMDGHILVQTELYANFTR